ncbi:hypothetical protein ACYF6T_21095 [Streptomyces sp. 7R007]
MLRGTPGTARTARTTPTHGRRGALIGASAAVVCLGAVLAACGGGDGRGGYVATGAAGGAPQASGTAAAPTGGVTLVPLEGERAAREKGERAATGRAEADTGTAAVNSPATASASARTPNPATSSPTPDGPGSGQKTPSSPPASPTPAPAPAALTWGAPQRTPTDRRWCEDVTLAFRNAGGTAVRSGTVTFGTHVIGALGIDWGTVASTVDLPAPIAADAGRTKTWTVCVDAWRVPLGMHIETKDVAVQWE